MPNCTALRVLSGNSSWSVASISASSLIVSTGGPLSRSASERSPALAADALHLQRARERVGVVLQRDDALHRRSVRVDQDDAALEQARRAGESAHEISSPPASRAAGALRPALSSFDGGVV